MDKELVYGESCLTIEYLWQPVGQGLRLMRMYGNTLCARVPGEIEGRPVLEIGAYCFSESEHLPERGYFITRVEMKRDKEEISSYTRVNQPSMPSISGRYLEEVELPDSVTVIHNAAFYNCRGLKILSAGGQIRAIGSDVFMNCIHLDRLTIRTSPEEENGLFLILERITTEVEVDFGPGICRIFFPEYYEWLNEISPAHIFSRSIEGEGLRMRRAFKDGKIDFAKYDQCFSNILTGETDQNIFRIAYDRLRWPFSLGQEAEEVYRQALVERMSAGIHDIIKMKNMDALTFVYDHFTPSQGDVSAWIGEMIEADWGQGSAWLLEKSRKTEGTFAEKSFDFDDW